MYAHRRHDICDTGSGKIYRRISPVKREALVARLMITDCLSARYSGYCGREHHGAICLLTLETGKIPIAGSVVGETGAFGKNSLRCS